MPGEFTPASVLSLLEDPDQGVAWCRSLGLRDANRGQRNLTDLAELGIPLDLLARLFQKLAQELPRLSDTDQALNNFARFVQASRSPLSLIALFERDPKALTELLRIFAISQHQSDLLIADPSSFDRLRIGYGTPSPREELIQELINEVRCYYNDRSAARLLQAFKQREMARIAYGDLIRGHRLEVVTQQLSFLADAVCEAAYWLAHSQLHARFGSPRRRDGRTAEFVILGLGKLGGLELNYSSDIDIVMLYEGEGATDGPRVIGNDEYFQRLGRLWLQLMTESSEYGVLYRVDTRLRPDGRQGPLVPSESAARNYYETKGRTWERQAWIKARPVAGDEALGDRFLRWMEPWVYRKFLSRGDIMDIQALKRQIERAAVRKGAESNDIKVGLGGIRDIEFVAQFLQLLNGGEDPRLRTGNTWEALDRLEVAGCLTRQERSILEENYVFLRRIEHFLQIAFDRQTHTLPMDPTERRQIAIRMEFQDGNGTSAQSKFETALAERRRLNRRILDHVLHEAFSDEEPIVPEADLILMPEPTEEMVDSLLRRYGFSHPQRAYQELLSLATEDCRFLSDARCRRYLAAIVQSLLAEIATTPDPGDTLIQLSQVSKSLGGKGVLWELFSENTASMKLYVRLCAAAPYLAGILTSNPGMIDELMDSLVLGKPPTAELIARGLEDLCRGAEDLEPILHGFKNSMHLRVGVRDILGKDDIQTTTSALSDVAEACLQQVIRREYERLVRKHGAPREDFIVLALGKLGGREPNYHSDLDLVFLFHSETEGAEGGSHSDCTTFSAPFFTELSQHVIRMISRASRFGKLYEVDARLRPAGRSGNLAMSLAEFANYFDQGRGQLWERQALCKARPVFGPQASRAAAEHVVRRILTQSTWQPAQAREIEAMRLDLQKTAAPNNLKRGPGGTMDIEFLVQLLQIRHAGRYPDILQTGTLEAIQALCDAGLLPDEHATYLDRSYRFLRSVEARIRLMNYTGRHELPSEPEPLSRLAYLLHYDDARRLVDDCHEFTRRNRELFQRYVTAAASMDDRTV